MEQHQEGLHPRILHPIQCSGRQRRLELNIVDAFDVNRQSVQYLVDFFLQQSEEDSSSQHEAVSQLNLEYFSLVQPSDGGIDVLRDLFSNQRTTLLTRIKLYHYNFGSEEDTSRVIGACRTNGSVTDLHMNTVRNLRGATLGNCLSGLLQNMLQLQRL
jgi:hypothetical protein